MYAIGHFEAPAHGIFGNAQTFGYRGLRETLCTKPSHLRHMRTGYVSQHEWWASPLHGRLEGIAALEVDVGDPGSIG